MLSIFYDLETTELNFCGQILNFAFVCVDEGWNVLSDFTGSIRVSRLQIPQPGALLANRTNILQHQATAEFKEAEAMFRIRQYLQEIIESEREPVNFLGYNSTRFDLPFLRTSMIRNGINPYFTRNTVKYRDVLHVSQKLACTDEKFKSLMPNNKSLSLANVTKALGLLDGEQAHESKADVMLTIELAKKYANEFGLDIRKWNQYEALDYDYAVRVYPSYDANHHKNPEENDSPRSRMMLLERANNQALWVDLDKWEAGAKDRSSVFWYNENTSAFFVECSDLPKKDIKIVQEVREKMDELNINLKTFFPPKNCDIEQFIYDIDIKERGALYDAIWIKDPTRLMQLKSKHGAEIYLRFLAANKPLEGQVFNHFKKYVMYRYGGKLKLSKYDFEEKFQEGVYSENFHPVYNEYLEEIDNKIKALTTGVHDCSFTNDLRRAEDVSILTALKQFIEESDITRFCGDALKTIVRKKNDSDS